MATKTARHGKGNANDTLEMRMRRFEELMRELEARISSLEKGKHSAPLVGRS